MSSGAERSQRVKTGVANKAGGRRTARVKKERNVSYQKGEWQRETEIGSHAVLAGVALLPDYFSLFLHPSAFQLPLLGFNYFKICAIGQDSLLETIKWSKQMNKIVWHGDYRSTYYLTTQAPASFQHSKRYAGSEETEPLSSEKRLERVAGLWQSDTTGPTKRCDPFLPIKVFLLK